VTTSRRIFAGTVLVAFATLAAGPLLAQPFDPSELPRWENKDTWSMSLSGLTVSADHDIELSLDGDGTAEWEAYEEAKQEFQEWFEETQEQLEDEFVAASGDAKIVAGRRLIEFVLEAEVRWERIKMPTSGSWSGPYMVTTTVTGMGFNASVTAQGAMTLVLEEDAPGSTGAKVTGTIPAGTTEGEFTLGFPGVVFSAGEIEQTWEGEAVGSARNLTVDGLLDTYIITYEGVVAAAPGTAVYLYGSDGRMTSQGYVVDELRNLYLIDQRTSPYESRIEHLLELTMTGRNEELDLRDLLIQYFIQYVLTIDAVKISEYAGASVPAIRREIALGAFNLCVGADAIADAAGLPLGIPESVGLERRVPGSLYDRWFERYFESGLAHHDQVVNGHTSITEARVGAELDRLNFVVRHVDHGWEALVSEELMNELELWFESPLLDRTYRPYHDDGLSLWVTRLNADPSLLGEALVWLDAQVWVAKGAFISEGLANVLGLLATPPVDDATLRAAAGPPP